MLQKTKFLSKLISNKKYNLEFVDQIDSEYQQKNVDGFCNNSDTGSTSLD
jgi:DNA-dependent RNA polymerase auxiliary subunit epsilon